MRLANEAISLAYARSPRGAPSQLCSSKAVAAPQRPLVQDSNSGDHAPHRRIAVGTRPSGARIGAGECGADSPHQLFAEMFKSMTGIEMTHVPRKASAPALTGVIGAHAGIVAPRALSAESKDAPWPITEWWSATTWHRSVWRGRYDDQFIKIRRALGIIAGTNVATTMTMLLSAL